jgi:hypothetical protein
MKYIQHDDSSLRPKSGNCVLINTRMGGVKLS